MSDAILPDIPVEAVDSIEEQYKALEAIRDALEAKMHALDSIDSIDNEAITVSATYAQSEIQSLADDIKVVSDKVDLILDTITTA